MEHSILFCVRILKREIELLGYTKNFNIFDELDKDKVIKDILKRLNIDDKKYPSKLIGSEISKAKDNMKSPEDYEKQGYGDFRKEQIAKVYMEYQKILKANDATILMIL